MADCPHGMTSAAWCDKCQAPPVKKRGSKPTTSATMPNGRKLKVGGMMNTADVAGAPLIIGNNIIDKAVDQPDGSTLFFKVEWLTNEAGERWSAKTRSQFTGSCKRCRGRIEMHQMIVKSEKTHKVTNNPNSDMAWVCLPCFINEGGHVHYVQTQIED